MIIQITNEAFLKLRYFVEECDTEISGFGKVRPIKVTRKVRVNRPGFFSRINFSGHFGFRAEPDNEAQDEVEVPALEIYDIEILPQVVSGVHATIDEETLAKFLHDKMKKGESVADYKVWWHSHVNMQAFFSGTDTATIEGSTEFPYLISIVTNKPGDLLMRYDVYKPQPFTEYCELEVLPPIPDKKLRQWCRDQIRRKVKEERIPLVSKPYTEPYDAHYRDTDNFRTGGQEFLDGYDDFGNELPIGSQKQQSLHFQDADDLDDDEFLDWGIRTKKPKKGVY